MARKTFLNGYPLPASDLNTYLMDQTVQTYADATARTAALATPTEGQMSYLADQNTAYVFDGSSWNAVVDAKNYGATLPNGAAGKNKVINGGFDIWQRGTSFSGTMDKTYCSDRWWHFVSGGTGYTVSQVTPSGLTGSQYALKMQRNSGSTVSGLWAVQDFETSTSIPFAGQTVTFSFYAKAGANYSAASNALAYTVFTGTGTNQSIYNGLTGQQAIIDQSSTLTTSWQRFSISAAVGPTATQLSVKFYRNGVGTAGADDSVQITGVQLEVGTVATPFSRAGGTIQGELAACQRYYWRGIATDIYGMFAQGVAPATTNAAILVPMPVTMRTAPTSVDYSALALHDQVNAAVAVTSLTIARTNPQAVLVTPGVASGLTQYRTYALGANNNAAAYLGFGAEL